MSKMYKVNENYKKQIEIDEEILKIYKASLGKNHSQTFEQTRIVAMRNLAVDHYFKTMKYLLKFVKVLAGLSRVIALTDNLKDTNLSFIV